MATINQHRANCVIPPPTAVAIPTEAPLTTAEGTTSYLNNCLVETVYTPTDVPVWCEIQS